MDNFYCFCLGLSLGLSAAFFTFGKFWLGITAGIPLGGALLVILIVVIVAIVEAPFHEHHDYHSGTGDGYRN